MNCSCRVSGNSSGIFFSFHKNHNKETAFVVALITHVFMEYWRKVSQNYHQIHLLNNSFEKVFFSYFSIKVIPVRTITFLFL